MIPGRAWRHDLCVSKCIKPLESETFVFYPQRVFKLDSFKWLEEIPRFGLTVTSITIGEFPELEKPAAIETFRMPLGNFRVAPPGMAIKITVHNSTDKPRWGELRIDGVEHP